MKYVNVSGLNLEDFRTLYAIKKREIALNKKYKKLYGKSEE